MLLPALTLQSSPSRAGLPSKDWGRVREGSAASSGHMGWVSESPPGSFPDLSNGRGITALPLPRAEDTLAVKMAGEGLGHHVVLSRCQSPSGKGHRPGPGRAAPVKKAASSSVSGNSGQGPLANLSASAP